MPRGQIARRCRPEADATDTYSGGVGRVTTRSPAVRYELTGDGPPQVVRRPDTLAVEEPMEIRVTHGGDSDPLSVIMRTPGDDFDLTLGFLHGEGLVHDAADVAALRPAQVQPARQFWQWAVDELAATDWTDAPAARRAGVGSDVMAGGPFLRGR